MGRQGYVRNNISNVLIVKNSYSIIVLKPKLIRKGKNFPLKYCLFIPLEDKVQGTPLDIINIINFAKH